MPPVFRNDRWSCFVIVVVVVSTIGSFARRKLGILVLPDLFASNWVCWYYWICLRSHFVSWSRGSFFFTVIRSILFLSGITGKVEDGVAFLTNVNGCCWSVIWFRWRKSWLVGLRFISIPLCGRRRGRQRKCWMDHIKECTSLPMPEMLARASYRKHRKRISPESSLMSPRRPNRSWDWTELNCPSLFSYFASPWRYPPVDWGSIVNWLLAIIARQDVHRACVHWPCNWAHKGSVLPRKTTDVSLSTSIAFCWSARAGFAVSGSLARWFTILQCLHR